MLALLHNMAICYFYIFQIYYHLILKKIVKPNFM